MTSLGHLWTGRRRLHSHYVIGDPANTTPIANSARRRRPTDPSDGGLLATRRSSRGAAEHDTAWFAGQRPRGGPQRSCSGATISGTAGRRPNRDCWPNRAAEELLGNYAISARRLQTSMGELRSKCWPRRSCLVLRDSASPTEDLSIDACSGGAAGGMCRSKHLKALWAADSDGAAGRTGRRSSTTSEAGHLQVRG